MSDEILDITESNLSVESQVASKGTRFGNLLIDSILVGIPISFIANYFVYGQFFTSPYMRISIDTQMQAIGLNYLILAIYYIAMEATIGKTLGKIMTNTKVVNHQGQAPTTGQVIGRSFARFIPFEAFSFLGERGIGWHDSLTKTYVIKSN